MGNGGYVLSLRAPHWKRSGCEEQSVKLYLQVPGCKNITQQITNSSSPGVNHSPETYYTDGIFCFWHCCSEGKNSLCMCVYLDFSHFVWSVQFYFYLTMLYTVCQGCAGRHA